MDQNYFCRGGQKFQNYIFTTRNKEDTLFLQKLMGKFQTLSSALASTSEAHAPETSYDKKAEEDNKNIFTNKHAMIFEIIFSYFYFNILIFEADMKSIEHKHALSAQHRLIITDTEHFVSALVVGPREYRYLFANL